MHILLQHQWSHQNFGLADIATSCCLCLTCWSRSEVVCACLEEGPIYLGLCPALSATWRNMSELVKRGKSKTTILRGNGHEWPGEHLLKVFESDVAKENRSQMFAEYVHQGAVAASPGSTWCLAPLAPCLSVPRCQIYQIPIQLVLGWCNINSGLRWWRPVWTARACSCHLVATADRRKHQHEPNNHISSGRKAKIYTCRLVSQPSSGSSSTGWRPWA